MTLSITFTSNDLVDETPAQQLEATMAALGFVRKTTTVNVTMREVAPPKFTEPSKSDEGPARPEPGPDTRGVMNVGLEHAIDAAVAAQKAQHDRDVETAKNIMRAAEGGADTDNVKAEAEEAARKEEARAVRARNLAGSIDPIERGPDPEYTHPSGRKFGQPGPGGKRRTKAEMAEDTAYLASLDGIIAARPIGEHPEPVAQEADDTTDGEGLEVDAESGGLIDQTLGHVANVIDRAADEQDAADEAAEAAGEKSQGGPLSLEDLRREIGLYAKKHGMAKASVNIPAIIEGPMLEVTNFEHAIARVKLATATGDGLLHEAPFDRKLPPLVEEAPHATKDDLMEAVMAYSAKYEGKGVKPASGGPTAVDLADVMRKTFPGTSGALSEIPATPEGYGKALNAVNAAITGNPYGRTPK